MLLIRAISFVLLFSVICGCKNKHPQEQKQAVIKLNLYSEPPTLDPRKAFDSTSVNAIVPLFEGLTRLGFDTEPTLALAKDVAISEDLTTYTFTLREAKWTNGDKITSHDFLSSWQSVLSPSFPAPAAYKMYMIKNGKAIKEGKLPVSELGIQTPDEKTLVVHLEHPAPYFLELLSFPIFYPINHRIASFYPDWAIDATQTFVSNGPFILTKWDHENEIILEKNPHYWDRDSVKLDSIHFVMINDTLTEYYLFESGQLDFAGAPLSNLSVEILPTLQNQGKLKRAPFSATYYFKINTDIFPLNNANIRKGLSAVIDRDEIVDHVMQVGHKSATSYVPALPNPVFNNKTPLLETKANLVEGKKLFTKGLEEQEITLADFPSLTLLYNTNREHKKVAEAIQHQWQERLGIKIYLEQNDWKVYLSKLAKQDYQIARTGWVGEYNDPRAFLLFFRTKEEDNLTGWENEDYKQLLDESDFEKDPAKRSLLLQKAEKILLDEMPIIPIYFIEGLYVQNPHLKNVVITLNGTADFKWAYLQ